MNRIKKYRIALWILSFAIAIESVLLIAVARKPRRVPEVKPPVLKGKIAIVLDDWGYNLNNLDILEGIGYPLTMAILPRLPYSQKAAEHLHNQGFEIILHLPMEPQEKVRLEKNTIMVSDDETKIESIIEEDIASIPYIKGVSNHMGSRVTADPHTMEIVFRELKSRGLYFLDSVATSKSVCPSVARRVAIRFARRDVFIDNKSEPAYIKEQIHKLKTKARAYGQAIGIGHDRKTTILVLKEVMPGLEKEGYKFVFVSELAK